MHKQKGTVEIVLILLLVAALGLAGYFYLQSGKTPLTPLEWFVEDEETLKDRTPSTPTPHIIEDWETYTSNNYKFSIKVPPGVYTEAEDDVVFFDFQKPSNVKLTLDVRLTTQLLGDLVAEVKTDADVSELTRITIGGLDGIKYKDYLKNPPNGPFAQYHLSGKLIQNGRVYSIDLHSDFKEELEKNQIFFDTVLSTFRFD